jgi:hypothetical protein
MDFVLLVLDPLLESMLVAVRVRQVNCRTQPRRCSWNKLLFVLLFHILHCFTIFYYGCCVVSKKKRGESLTWLSFAPNTFSFSELWFDSSCCGASKPVRWSRSLDMSLALSSVTSVFGAQSYDANDRTDLNIQKCKTETCEDPAFSVPEFLAEPSQRHCAFPNEPSEGASCKSSELGTCWYPDCMSGLKHTSHWYPPRCSHAWCSLPRHGTWSKNKRNITLDLWGGETFFLGCPNMSQRCVSNMCVCALVHRLSTPL